VAHASRRAILNLKIQRDRLHKYQRRITVITTREHEIAKALLAQGDRARALLALRRKKYQESLLAKTDAQLEQLEQLTSSVEFALVQKDVVFGLQEGTRVLKEIQREMGGLEQVEKLMGETAEAVAYQQVGGRGGGLQNALTTVCRRLVICWEAGFRIRMRMRLRMSWRRWRRRLRVCCRVCLRRSCRGRRGRRRGRSRERNRGKLCWHPDNRSPFSARSGWVGIYDLDMS
jgi:hypothetical protein